MYMYTYTYTFSNHKKKIPDRKSRERRKKEWLQIYQVIYCVSLSYMFSSEHIIVSKNKIIL